MSGPSIVALAFGWYNASETRPAQEGLYVMMTLPGGAMLGREQLLESYARPLLRRQPR